MEASINGTDFLVNLLGAAALLVWGLRMVRTGVMRAFGGDLRKRLGRSLQNRFAAFAAGFAITILLQSSTATGLLTASFASHGLVGTASALAVMLGADVGSSVVAQIVSLLPHELAPLLILAGVVAFLGSQATRLKDIGRTIVGLGLMLLALRLIGAAAEPVRGSQVLMEMFRALGSEPLLAVLLAAVLTVLSTSSLAIVLLVIAFAAGGLVSLPLAFALILGANLGATVMPLLGTATSGAEARRVPLANFIFRLTGVAIVLPLLSLIAPFMELVELPAARQVADFHTAFNLAIAILFLPLIGPVAALCARVLPEKPRGEEPGKPQYLDTAALDSPAVAIANAARETLRMGDIIEKMLRQTLEVFRNDDRKLLREVEALDDGVDQLHEAIKLYLTEMSRDAVDKADQKRSIDVITFTTNLEHIGDIIDKNLMELAAKKIKNKLRFSTEGFAEICNMHQRVENNLKLALNVFISGDVKLARRLLEEKVTFREMERAASEGHFARLRSGKLESIETSSLHLDILRDLKRINSHLTSVAYPILDAAGELTQSRLRKTPADLGEPAKVS
ncbi:MAG: Na/Pi cotransporter family protein [Pseudomonadota bacterium]